MVAINDKSMPGSEASHCRTRPLVDNLYQGTTPDAVTGLYDGCARDYSPTLGRWMEQDPAQYISGANTYQFVDSSPVGNVDAAGLKLTLPEAQKMLRPPWIAVGPPELVSRTYAPDGPARTTESGWIYKTYTTVVPERRTTTYREQALLYVPGNTCPAYEIFTITRVRQVTETIVANNAAAIHQTVQHLTLDAALGTAVGAAAQAVPIADLGGGLVLGYSAILAAEATFLDAGASSEEATPSTHYTVGQIIQSYVEP
jgi:RHS repeat-associated protein